MPTSNGANSTVNGSSSSIANYDVVVVGAGFSGISALYNLRKLGMTARVFEAGGDFGGVWYWNRYPGARVDSETPFYQLNIPEVYQAWDFSCRFPDHKELRKYMAHIDKTLDLRKDTEFNAKVVEATWNTEAGRWTVKTEAGHVATCKYLILASGLLVKTHYPDFPGLAEYKGVIHHTGFWPENLSVKGKRVAVIGAGATSVQVVQELAKEAGQLTMFMRRPSYCIPMGQRKFTAEEQNSWKTYYDSLFKAGRLSKAGFPNRPPDIGTFDRTPEEREIIMEELWKHGAFNFLSGGFNNTMIDKEANRIVYDFWRKKTRARMSDPVKQDLMAPEEPPYFFGTKRIPLEHDYYEMLDQPSVEIINLNSNPLKTFTEKGMLMDDGRECEFDYVVLATGFESFTGSLTTMGLKNKDGVDMKDIWKDGVRTYLGMLCHGFPNAFLVYSPQAPTALSNGPTVIECQVEFVMETIAKLEKEKAKSIEPTREAQEEWKILLDSINDKTLFPFTSSWWTGGNIPGKKAENMTYVAGIPTYERTCREKLKDWEGFEVVAA
ncbi:FAD/NAD(P)-binding domain-containing protein [Lepidopterella palustris CBS 459.81]|uniref:FAD/NAD(P)-binding domain-containing protein n=1 Tax=Lepidopterella palustris CBS 459.81 TaxID=1314670 RepID=A0A8E2E0D7_9PEZI|nr:FAD/NAD(P)-binding domain-containing protein [Lepidopterella palustris CBS 459.81]